MNDDNFQFDDLKSFSYVTLNKHPLNSLKVLGMLNKSDGNILPW